MTLKLKNWRDWSAIDKATFVGQCFTIVGFFSASLFSYLGWREASEARYDQRQFFVEEKSPDIVIKTIDFLPMNNTDNTLIRMLLKNEGGSSAQNVKVSVYPTKFTANKSEFDPMLGDDTGRYFNKGQEKEVLSSIIRPSDKMSKWDLSTARIYNVKTGKDYEIFALVGITYESRFGNIQSSDYYLEAKRR